MRILYDSRWTPELASSDISAKEAQDFLSLERTARRIEAATNRAFVWASVAELDAPKYLVRDVRILCERDYMNNNLFAETQRLQVDILEGWRTPDRVWTDEEDIEIIEGVQ